MKQFNDQILNIAHRGASALAPENTMAAIQRAYDCGADGVEFDVQLTKDSQVIVLHDETLKRTTNGSGAAIKKSLEEIRLLDAGHWFSPEFKDERIPTFEVVLDYCKEKLLMNVELKLTRDPHALVSRVAESLHNYDLLAQCLVTSFDPVTVHLFHNAVPDCLCGLLIKKVENKVWEGPWDFIAPNSKLIDPSFISEAAIHQKEIITWTVNEEPEMRNLLAMGIGRIITNHPDVYKKVINRQKKY